MDDRAILDATRALLGLGVSKVCVSLGSKGVIAVDAERAFAVRVNHCPEQTVTQIGCGDTLVAGLAVGMLRGGRWEDGVKWGVACATANLYSPEPGRFDKALAQEISRQIEMTPL